MSLSNGELLEMRRTYTYRDDGRKTSATETRAGDTTIIDWTYDNLGRLIEEARCP